MSHRHILIPLAALSVAACSDSSLTDSSPVSADRQVASITLAADSLTLDMRSTVPQSIRFSIVDAAGESLCGRVPVSVQADTAAFTAQLSPADPCLITLTPRAERSGWLRVQAGEKQVSAPVSVHHRRYRWAFDVPSGPHMVGTTVQVSFTVWGDNDKPIAGIPVELAIPADTQTVVTGLDGTARVSWTLPTSTRASWHGGADSLSGRQPGYRVTARAGIIDGTPSADLNLVPGAPHRIQFYLYTVNFISLERCWPSAGCGPSDHWTRYVAVTGDTVRIFSRDEWVAILLPWGSGGNCPDIFVCPPAYLYYRDYHFETLVAAVVDQYGNPTSTVPTLETSGLGAQVDAVRERFLSAEKSPCCDWSEWVGGKVAVTNLHDGTVRGVLTFTAPGVAPRTVIVSAYGH